MGSDWNEPVSVIEMPKLIVCDSPFHRIARQLLEKRKI